MSVLDELGVNRDSMSVFESLGVDRSIEFRDEPETMMIENTGEIIQLPSGGLSRLNAIRKEALRKGQKNTQSLDIGFKVLFGNDDPDLEAQLLSLQKQGAVEIPAEGFIENAVRATSEQIPLLRDIVGKGIERGAEGAVIGGTGALILGQFGPQAATPEEIITVPGAALAFGGRGFTLGLAEESFIKESAGAFLEFREIKDVDGNPISNDAARIGAVFAGGLSAGLELIPVLQITKMIPGSKKFFTKLGAKEGDAVKIPGTKQAIINFVQNIAKVTATEAVTEAAQEAIVITGGGIIKILSEGEFETTPKHEIIDRLIEASKEAAFATPGIAGPVASTRLAVDIHQARVVARDQTASSEQVQDPDVKKEVDKTKDKIDAIEVEKEEAVETIENPEQLNTKLVELEARKQAALIELDENLAKVGEKREALVTEAGEKKAPIEDKVAKARVKKLNTDISAIDKQLDTLEARFLERFNEDKPVQKIENQIDKLVEKRDRLDNERQILLDEGIRRTIKPELGKKDVVVKGKELERAEKRTAKQRAIAVAKGFREGITAAKKDTKAAQNVVIKVIEQSGLTAADKAKFIRSIKNIDSAQKAAKNLPKIQERVLKLLDEQIRRETLGKIKKSVKAAKKSQVIAVDFANRIQEVISAIDTQKRSEATRKKLEDTLDFFSRNPDERAPKKVLKKLEILNKKPINEVSTTDLLDILQEINRLQEQGKLKLELKKKQATRLQEKRLNELSNTVKPLISKPQKRASIGERLNRLDEVRNTFTQLSNKARSVSLALNPMDVFFDMMDNNADYKGAAHTIFKKTMNRAFSRYLNLKEEKSRPLKDIADELSLDDRNFERIGVFAAAQQEGGMEKLIASGFTTTEVEAVKLTKNEKAWLNVWDKMSDSMFPLINDVMINVYNKDVQKVSHYFPFMTDFEAMDGLDIDDTLGDSLPSPTPEASLRRTKKDVEKGFTKSRVGGKQVIRVDAMNIALKHIDNAAYLIEMSEDIRQLGFLAQSSEFGEIAGDVGQRFTVDWIDLLARKGAAKDRIAALDALRRNTGAAVLAYKLSSLMVQPTALADGAALVGGGYVARGVQKVATSKEWRVFLRTNIPKLRERVGDDPAYVEMGGEGIIGQATEVGFWALKNLDLLTASAVTAGAYIRSVEERGGVVDLTNPDPIAIQEAQFMLDRTQSSQFALDQPLVISAGKLTGNVSLDKLIFQFQSFMLNRWSLIKHDMASVGIGRKKTAQAFNAAIFLTLAMTMELGVRRLSKEMIAALTQDDLEPWEDTIRKEAVMTAIGQIPIVSNVVGSFEYGSNPVPSISLINNIAKRGNAASKAQSSEKRTQNALSASVLATGSFFGVPGTLQAEQLIRKGLK